MNHQPPSIGRIVSYTPTKGDVETEPRPALIIGVHGDDHRKSKDSVILRVFTPMGDNQVEAEWSATPSPGCWNWLQPRPLVASNKETSDEPSTTQAPVSSP